MEQQQKGLSFRVYLLMTVLMVLLFKQAIAMPTIQVLVSFSMPNQLLEETLMDAAQHQIPAVLNGLYQDSMRETAVKIFELSKKIPDLTVQIDPTVFERFEITQVPAWVFDNQTAFDVVLGNVRFERALDEARRFGDTRKDL